MPHTFSLLTHENHQRKNLEQNTNKKTLEKSATTKKELGKMYSKKLGKNIVL